METLTAKETELFKSLVRLGDSEQLALETVLAERNRPVANETYRFAYYG